jgi:hypothetical protein
MMEEVILRGLDDELRTIQLRDSSELGVSQTGPREWSLNLKVVAKTKGKGDILLCKEDHCYKGYVLSLPKIREIARVVKRLPNVTAVVKHDTKSICLFSPKIFIDWTRCKLRGGLRLMMEPLYLCMCDLIAVAQYAPEVKFSAELQEALEGMEQE